jgi:hypothetical protein
MTVRRATILLALAVSACATESLPEPEPTIYTRGAFVAVRTEGGAFALFRTLDTFEVEDDTVLLQTRYDVDPRTCEEARELATDADLPVRELVTVSSGNGIAASEHCVVWYRTLTEEERSRAE